MTEPAVPEVVRARPRKARVVCWVAAGALVVIFTAVAFGLRGPTDGSSALPGEAEAVFGVADQVAMIGLGLLGALAILAFTRPRVEADRRGVRIRNLIGSYDLPWEVVERVRFDRGAPWVSLELRDDDVVAVMAIQAADKQYAVEAARGLRALLASHRAVR